MQWNRWYTKKKGLSVNWALFSRALLKVLGPRNLMMPQGHYHNWSKFLLHKPIKRSLNFFCSQLKQISTAQAYQKLPEHFLMGCCIGGSVDEIRLEVKIQKPLHLIHLHWSCSTCGPRFVRISTKQLNSINIWILELKWRSVKNMAFDPKCQSSKVLTSEVKMVEAILVWFVSLLINSKSLVLRMNCCFIVLCNYCNLLLLLLRLI